MSGHPLVPQFHPRFKKGFGHVWMWFRSRGSWKPLIDLGALDREDCAAVAEVAWRNEWGRICDLLDRCDEDTPHEDSHLAESCAENWREWGEEGGEEESREWFDSVPTPSMESRWAATLLAEEVTM